MHILKIKMYVLYIKIKSLFVMEMLFKRLIFSSESY